MPRIDVSTLAAVENFETLERVTGQLRKLADYTQALRDERHAQAYTLDTARLARIVQERRLDVPPAIEW